MSKLYFTLLVTVIVFVTAKASSSCDGVRRDISSMTLVEVLDMNDNNRVKKCVVSYLEENNDHKKTLELWKKCNEYVKVAKASSKSKKKNTVEEILKNMKNNEKIDLKLSVELKDYADNENMSNIDKFMEQLRTTCEDILNDKFKTYKINS